ncbi:fumarylacetoacetate hydrolase family protein [Woeseia oceani]|uniref:Fumarylacetoacetase-like C-terminal domain-containing protein n=1 Tax=Woeseia oceani TaxID=1548547 RepID=A0A193LDD1_9GAMM|nr:fumarylacetoacetate hydrolase family protein [Woeseia oceani]ANO50517.1 hypothetical protein BA177_04190 [Woeseia oceani]
MKLVTYSHADRLSIGVINKDYVIDLSRHAPQLPRTMRELLEAGQDALNIVAAILAAGHKDIPLSELTLEAPIPNPRKFLGIGGNTHSHLEEVKAAGVPIKHSPHQTWFNKQVSCINGPFGNLHLPKISAELDYEGELAVVIGQRCRHVPREDAYNVIAGYMVCNDVSVRDWQLRSPTSTLGKSFDTHGPTGPWLTTRDEVPDPHRLSLKTWVNGELRMDGRSDEFLHNIDTMIAELSTVFTLEPGDILATGSPAGVGALMTPPAFLRSGDVVRVEVEGLGAIENKVLDEPDGYVYVPLLSSDG